MNTYIFDDGGRAAAGYKGNAGDCVVRAIAIAAEKPYSEVYRDLFDLNRTRRNRPRGKTASPRDGGTHRATIRQYMERLGWRWVATMGIGTGCKVHLRADELPAGRLVAALSHHMVAVIDGIIHDTYDCSRDGTRCVYGYFTFTH